ncbi:MAG: hydrogen gas-evolving membrane-bound hydrogenase subunit E [Candidatus Izemoplasmataceae bacterium]
MRKYLSPLVFFALFMALAVNILSMPSPNTDSAPSYNEATKHYLEHSLEETGSVNIIAAILADYRGFDTFGETIVLFTAIVAVVSVLRKDEDSMAGDPHA